MLHRAAAARGRGGQAPARGRRPVLGELERGVGARVAGIEGQGRLRVAGRGREIPQVEIGLGPAPQGARVLRVDGQGRVEGRHGLARVAQVVVGLTEVAVPRGRVRVAGHALRELLALLRGEDLLDHRVGDLDELLGVGRRGSAPGADLAHHGPHVPLDLPAPVLVRPGAALDLALIGLLLQRRELVAAHDELTGRQPVAARRGLGVAALLEIHGRLVAARLLGTELLVEGRGAQVLGVGGGGPGRQADDRGMDPRVQHLDRVELLEPRAVLRRGREARVEAQVVALRGRGGLARGVLPARLHGPGGRLHLGRDRGAVSRSRLRGGRGRQCEDDAEIDAHRSPLLQKCMG